MAELAGFDASQAEQLALAVDEASANVIEHAYEGAGDRTFELRYWDAERELRIDVIDDGGDGGPAIGADRRPRALRQREADGRPRRAPDGPDHGLGDLPPRLAPQRLLHGEAQAGLRPGPLP